MAYTLNKGDKNKKEIESLNEEEVLVDIYTLNNSETEAVYLSAASINKLFLLFFLNKSWLFFIFLNCNNFFYFW